MPGVVMAGVVGEPDRDGAPQVSPRRPRTDAVRNRVALLAAAQTLYAERGIDVPLEEIAKQAGVGIATLYRNFPRGKVQLVSEATVGQVTRSVDVARAALT